MAPRFRFGPFELEPTGPSLRRNGEEVHLRRKTFQVLVYLVEQRHRFVGKQELWDDLWAGSAVTDDALVQCVTDIRRAFDDDSRQPQYIKTLPRVGYRFIAPVVEEDADAPPKPEQPAVESTAPPPIDVAAPVRSVRRARVPAVTTMAVLMVVVAALVLLAVRGRRATAGAVAGTGRPAVMVMYLENKSASADLDWLRQGLADMLISGLSRSDRFTVVGRQRLDALLEHRAAGEAVTLDRALALASEIHVDKVVLGTFGRLGDRLRVDVQLYDTQSAGLVASEALVADRAEQILTEIDGLSVRLATRLGGEGRPQRALADVMTDNLEAYRFYSLGVEKANALRNVEAIDLLTAATRLDPRFAMAHARIGYTYAVAWDRRQEGKPFLQKAFNLSDRLTAKDRLSITAWYAIANLDFPEAIRIYRRLIDAYPLDLENYSSLTRLLGGMRQFDEAIRVARAGLSIDPEAVDLHNRIAIVYGESHQFDRALEHARRYVAIAPDEPNAYDTLGLMLTGSGRYEEAEQQLSHALALKRDWEIPLIHLANVHVRQGRYREASAGYQRYVDLAPGSMERVRGLDNLAAVADRLGRHDEAHAIGDRAQRESGVVSWTFVLAALERHDGAALIERAQTEIAQKIIINRGTPGNNRWRYFSQATIALRSGRTDEALARFREVLREPALLWDREDYEDCLANALVEIGRAPDAIPEYERIFQFNPNHALARYGLARAYDRLGRAESAVRQYAKFLEIWRRADRDVPEVVEATRRLAALAPAARTTPR